MNTLLLDARFALRTFARTPGFAALAVLTLAIGIGANTAIFSVTNAVLLRQLAYRDPDRLVLLDARSPSENVKQGPLTWVRFQQVRDRNQSFAGIAALTADAFNLTGRGDPEQLQAARVSWNFFQILGVAPRPGRAFLAEEDRPELYAGAIATAPGDAPALDLDFRALERPPVRLPAGVAPERVWRATLDAAAAMVDAQLARVDAVAGPRRRLVVTGGWARDEAVLAAKARLGPLETPPVVEAGCRGAALLAGVAAGLFESADALPPVPAPAGRTV